MKTKITQFVPSLLVLLVIGFRYFSTWCIGSISSCYGSWIHQIYQYFTYPLHSFSLFVLPITIILIFVSRNIFNSWLKFAVWTLPLLLILIATQPVVSSFLSTNRDDAARLAGGVFAAASFLLIIWKYFSTRRTI
jgi:ABC-type dipeptide/oligopeptide/nickel transport system permease subunit